MNKAIKTILLVAGVVLLAYGIYILIQPEAAVSVGNFSVSTQDNTNAYITIGLGLGAVVLSMFAGKK
jgi:hypothetical protein